MQFIKYYKTQLARFKMQNTIEHDLRTICCNRLVRDITTIENVLKELHQITLEYDAFTYFTEILYSKKKKLYSLTNRELI